MTGRPRLSHYAVRMAPVVRMERKGLPRRSAHPSLCAFADPLFPFFISRRSYSLVLDPR